jgi:hypothetical protein
VGTFFQLILINGENCEASFDSFEEIQRNNKTRQKALQFLEKNLSSKQSKKANTNQNLSLLVK